MKTLRFLIMAAIAVAVIGRADAVSIYWSGGYEGDWNSASKWTGGKVPADGDYVYIQNPNPCVVHHTLGTHSIVGITCDRTLDLAGGWLSVLNYSTCANFALTGGNLFGEGSLNLSGSSAWTAGSFSNTGGINNKSGASLEISYDNDKYMTTSLTNSGTITQNGAWEMYSNGSLTNNQYAFYEIQSDTGINSINGTGSILNEGIFRKNSGTGISDIAPAFHNNNLVQCYSGTLRFLGGGVADYGMFNPTTAGSAIIFDNDIFTMEEWCSMQGPGRVELASGGTFSLDASCELAVNLAQGFKLAGGTITGFGHIVNGEQMEWSGGALSFAEDVENANEMSVTGSTTKIMQGSNLNNKGIITHKGKGSIQMGLWSEIINSTGATYELQTDAGFLCSDNSSTFRNLGTLRKLWSYGNSPMEAYLDNQGYVDIQTGALSLSGGGQFYDCGFNVVHPARLALDDNYFWIYGISETGGSGSAQLNGGTFWLTDYSTAKFGLETGLSLAGTNIKGYGNFINTWNADWSTGTVSDLTHFINEGNMAISGSDNKQLQAGALFFNADTVTQTGLGNLTIDETSELNNQTNSTYTFESDSGISGTGTINNSGEFNKIYSNGVSTIEPHFNNIQGQINISSGSVALTGGGNFYDGAASIIYPGNLTISAGEYSMTGAFTASGAGSATLSGGIMNLAYGAQTRFSLDWGLHLSGITTKGPGNFINGWNADWTSGTIGDATNFVNEGTMAVIGSGTHYMQASRLVNPGTINHTGTGGINFKQSATIENHGTYEISTDADFTSSDNGNVFRNDSIFRKLRSNGITNFQTAFSNRGLIDLNTGTLRFSGGGDWIEGQANVVGQSMLELSSGTFNLTGRFQATGEGSARLSGTLVLSSGAQAVFGLTQGFYLSGGTVAGPGSIQSTVKGDWSGGSVTEDATLLNNATMTISGSATKSLIAGRLANMSIMSQTGTGPLVIDDNSQLDNFSIATFNMQGDCPITGGGTINNSGIFQKTQGTSAAEIEPIMNNTGTLEVSSGAMVFRNPAAQMVEGNLTAGTWIVHHGCALDIGRDTMLTANAADVTLIGESDFPQFDSVITNTGKIHLLEGRSFESQGLFTNSGEMEMLGGEFLSGKNINTGLWHGAGTIKGTFSNRGILKPNRAYGQISTAGSLTQTETGTLQIEIGGKLSGQYAAVTAGGNASLAGTLQITLANGFLPQRGDTFQIVSSKTRSGKFTTITGQTLSNGLKLNPIYTANGVTLVVGESLPSVTETATVASLKQMESGMWLSVPGVVSAVFTDAFFVQDANRVGGVRVTSLQTPPAVGQRVQVAGLLSATDLCLTLTQAQWVPFPDALKTPAPMFLGTKLLGGRSLGLQSGVYEGTGLNNVGLLVRVTGKVTYIKTGYYAYIDDGSGLYDGNILGFRGSPVLGVRVVFSPGASIPTGAQWASVTGISYRINISDRPQRSILATSVQSTSLYF